MHSGGKPYACTACLVQFTSSGNLKTHVKLHGNSRDFMCDDCGKQFRRKDKLREHVKRTHSTSDNLCACLGCGHQFGNRRFLQRHEESHRPIWDPGGLERFAASYITNVEHLLGGAQTAGQDKFRDEVQPELMDKGDEVKDEDEDKVQSRQYEFRDEVLPELMDGGGLTGT